MAGSDDTYLKTTEILKFIKDGDKAVRISPEKNAILVMGLTGSGKSTLVHFLTGHVEQFEAEEVGEDTGEFLIRDKNNKVCKFTLDSCTTLPDLITDKSTGTPFYDNPGFHDTRNFKHDIGVTYFIKKILDHTDSIKLVFTVNYPSVRKGVDRMDFMKLIKSVSSIKDIEKFKDSIALVVTKVDNNYFKKRNVPFLVPDQSIIRNIGDFLLEVKNHLVAKKASGDDSLNYAQAIKFVDILLTKYPNSEEYSRIGLFRRPDEAGSLNTKFLLENKKNLTNILLNNLKFTQTEPGDFGYTLSAETMNEIHKVIEEVNIKIASDVEYVAKEIEEGILLRERSINDIQTLYSKFHFAYEAMQNITTAQKFTSPRDFLQKIRQAASILKVDVTRKSVDNILHFDKFLNFIQTVSNLDTNKSLKWIVGLTEVVQSFENSQNWYYFLINLQKILTRHEVQKHLSKDSRVMDNLRKQIQDFEDGDSTVKEELRRFLAQVFPNDSEKEFFSVKKVKLNSWKLKFLMDMLDFQVLTLCQNNKLTVTGNYVHLSDVNRKRCLHVKFVEIFALSKVFIDSDFDRRGSKIQLTIMAPTWDVIGSPRIILDGAQGPDHSLPSASDGFGPGTDGEDGQPGLPGGAGGNFLGVGWNCVNCEFMTISVAGGEGGKGQNGGNGINGTSGVRPVQAKQSKNIFNVLLVRVSHEDRSSNGQTGGSGGKGGAGGVGGRSGSVTLVMFDTPEDKLPKTTVEDGRTGRPGISGLAGNGGVSELLVESKTYILGFETWSNGFVQHHLFSLSNGFTSHEHNSEDIKEPESPTMIVDPARAVNHYKSYLRNNLGNSPSIVSLNKFLNQIDTSQDVRVLYDTLGLVDDLKNLENQYHKLHRQFPLMPFYKSLLDQIEIYARDPPFSEISGQRKKVLAFLYLSTLSKICTIGNMNNNLVINVKEYLGALVKDVNQLLNDFMVPNKRNHKRTKYHQEIRNKIEEANGFVQEVITRETQAILAQFDGQIQTLVLETQKLKKITRNNLKNLNEKMISRAISSVVRIASYALDFTGVLGLVTEGFIDGSRLLSESLSFDKISSAAEGVLSKLSETVEDFISSTSDDFKGKINSFVSQLFDVDELFGNYKGENSAVNETRRVISEAREDFSESVDILGDPRENVEKVYTKRNELVGFIRNQISSMEKLVEHDPKLSEAVDVLSRAEEVLKLPEGVYNMLKVNKVGDLSRGAIAESEKLLQLEAYEKKIYDIIVPLCLNLKNQFSQNGLFEGQSHAALDVSKWKVQNALSDIKMQLMAMTEGFEVEGALGASVEKLKFGISTMIQVYDRIQEYRDEAALVDYLADITSNHAYLIEVTDRELSDAIDDLLVIMKSNLILADYEKAMSAFGQHIFPFAQLYLDEFVLPTSLQANSTEEFLSDVTYKITSVQHKLVENDLTISNKFDSYLFLDIDFSSWSPRGPFHVWKYETNKEIPKLLQGEEVVLYADVTKIDSNAVKFKEIGIRFKLANEANQRDFDDAMDGFYVEMNHLGLSYYRCGTKFYVMAHDSQKITHSVNEETDGKFSHHNGVYAKIVKNEPLLSPYTMWKIKIVSLNGSFDVLKKFHGEIIDLALEGRGSYVSRNIDETVCNNHLDQFYQVDETISEIPSVEYKIDPNRSEVNAEVVAFRQRRSPEDDLDSEDILDLDENRRYDFNVANKGNSVLFDPAKRFMRWLTGGENNTGSSQPNLFSGFYSTVDYEDALLNAPSVDYEDVKPFDDHFAGSLNSDSQQSSINRVNYDLVNSQSNLLLLDMLLRYKTGAKPSRGKKVLGSFDDGYAQSIAYRSYVPQIDKETVIVK